MSVPQRDDPVRAPIFNAVPAAVLILATAMIGVAAFTALAPETGRWIIASSVILAGPAGEVLPTRPLGHLAPLILHVFVHFGLFHLMMNLAILVGGGRAVGMALGTGLKGNVGFLVFFFVCSMAGAGLEILVPHTSLTYAAGASTGVSGVLAAVGWVRGGFRGMLRLALPWIAINIVIALTDLVLPIPVSWAGHVGGTIAGAVLFPLVLALFGKARPPRQTGI